MINNKADKVVKELVHSLKIDIKIIWNQWKLGSLSMIMFICRINHKLNPNRGGSYIDFTDWVKSKQKQSKKFHQQKR